MAYEATFRQKKRMRDDGITGVPMDDAPRPNKRVKFAAVDATNEVVVDRNACGAEDGHGTFVLRSDNLMQALEEGFDVPLQQAIAKFSQVSQTELRRLREEEMLDYRAALERLATKIRANDRTPLRPNVAQLLRVMTLTKCEEWQAAFVLVVKSELSKLTRRGLSSRDSVLELIERIRKATGTKRMWSPSALSLAEPSLTREHKRWRFDEPLEEEEDVQFEEMDEIRQQLWP